MSKLNIAPKFGETSESIAEAFKWWEAEHDRAAWENDQISEEERQRRAEQWKATIELMDMSWWTPKDMMKPYHSSLQEWRSKSITLPK